MSVRWMIGLLGSVGLALGGCDGAGPEFACSCAGDDVEYQPGADDGAVASEATCTAGYEFGYIADDGQTAADAEADAVETCCAPGAVDCTCSCAAL